MILTLSRNISNPDLSCDEFGSRPKESDSRVGPKYADSTRGLSSMIRDSKIFRAARGLSLLTQPVTPGRRGRTQTRPVATLLFVEGRSHYEPVIHISHAGRAGGDQGLPSHAFHTVALKALP